jgi:DNA-binding MarR family transcriptional regulator
MLSSETEIDLLEKIVESPSNIRQRDLARIIGLSLGMANAIVKRLVQKGLLKIQKVNNRNIQYIVSPKGMEKIARRSYRYFRQTVKNVVYYKEAIEELLRRVASQGFTEIVLVGASDLDFIIEHLCAKHHLVLRRASKAGPERNRQRFLLYSEKYPNTPPAAPNSALLRRLILLAKPRSRPFVAS